LLICFVIRCERFAAIKMSKKGRNIIWIGGLLIVLTTSSFMFKTFEDDQFCIYFDEHLISGKKAFLSEAVEPDTAISRPNIIIILADDLGQTDVSLYGNRLITTPNIDSIGQEGVTFRNGYISSPVCSPSRAGLLTGRYQNRFGHELQPNHRYLRNMVEYFFFKLMPKFKPLSPVRAKGVPSPEERLRQGLPPSEITLAEFLKKYDYATALIGKWHLGAADFAMPCARGFDYQYGFYEAFTLYAEQEDTSIVNMPVVKEYMDYHQWRQASGRTGNCAILRNCCEHMEEAKYLTDVLTDEAIRFIDAHQSEPFFLYLPYNAPHSPLQAQKKYFDSFIHIKDPVKRVYAAMIKNLDDEVGRLLQHVDHLQLSEKTIVVFLSDNGGATSNGTTDNKPYRGGKFTNFEGGLKVPFMIRYPAMIGPGTVYDQPVISLDIFVTIASMIGAALPADRVFDGVDLLPYISGQKAGAPHDRLFWRSDFNKSVLKNGWKLIINEFDNSVQLYHLPSDTSEKNNQYKVHPELVRELSGEIDRWEEELVKPLWPRVVNYVYKDKYGKYVFAI